MAFFTSSRAAASSVRHEVAAASRRAARAMLVLIMRVPFDGLVASGAFAPHGEENAKRSAASGRAVDFDPPLVVGYDAIADRQAEASPDAHPLGGEAGVEDALQVLGRDAGAAVGDLDRDLGARQQ